MSGYKIEDRFGQMFAAPEHNLNGPCPSARASHGRTEQLKTPAAGEA